MTNSLFEKLSQLVSSEVCLKCEGCCRFKEKDSCWRPKVAGSEMEKNPEAFLHQVGDDGHILTKSHQGKHCCVFLDPSENTCGIYERRPLECRLYPFVLVHKQQEVWLSAHLACPYIQEMLGEKVLDDYLEGLKKVLLSGPVKEFLKDNISLVGSYSQSGDEFVDLFCIHSGGTGTW